MKGVVVTGEVRASADVVFEILSDVSHHQALAGRRMSLVDVSRDGEGRMVGVIDLHVPPGVRRTIATREVVRESPSLIWGVAAASTGSVALVSWSLTETGEQRTRVTLAVSPVSLRGRDRVGLRLGGRLVLSAILRNTVKRLEALIPVFEPPGENGSSGQRFSVARVGLEPTRDGL